jgi:hypothetical protein
MKSKTETEDLKMARPVIYPPEIRKSQSWERLYYYWKNVRSEAHAPAFDNFMNFYNWAMNNGYADNRKLRKVDPNRPWVPDNGTWLPIEPGTGSSQVKVPIIQTVSVWP